MAKPKKKADEMVVEKKVDDDQDPLLKLREVQVELSVSRLTLFRWIKAGKLTAVKVGQQWRVRRSVVEAKKGEV